MSKTTSLPPLMPDEWPAEIAHLSDGFAGQLNIYRTMAHHPKLLASWAGLRRHVVTDNALGEERLEVAILRIANNLESQYEWEHHVRRARSAGLSKERIISVKGNVEGMLADDAILSASVDSLIDSTTIPSDLLASLTALVGTKGVFDLIATVGFYKTLGCIAETYAVTLDDLTE